VYVQLSQFAQVGVIFGEFAAAWVAAVVLPAEADDLVTPGTHQLADP